MSLVGIATNSIFHKAQPWKCWRNSNIKTHKLQSGRIDPTVYRISSSVTMINDIIQLNTLIYTHAKSQTSILSHTHQICLGGSNHASYHGNQTVHFSLSGLRTSAYQHTHTQLCKYLQLCIWVWHIKALEGWCLSVSYTYLKSSAHTITHTE